MFRSHPLPFADVGSTKGQRKPRSTNEEGQGSISPFAGGKAFPANMDADTMTIAAGDYICTQYCWCKQLQQEHHVKQVCNAGTVTAMLAANGVGGGNTKSSETVSLMMYMLTITAS